MIALLLLVSLSAAPQGQPDIEAGVRSAIAAAWASASQNDTALAQAEHVVVLAGSFKAEAQKAGLVPTSSASDWSSLAGAVGTRGTTATAVRCGVEAAPCPAFQGVITRDGNAVLVTLRRSKNCTTATGRGGRGRTTCDLEQIRVRLIPQGERYAVDSLWRLKGAM